MTPSHNDDHSGELQEPSKKVVSKAIETQDLLVENAKNGIDDSQQQLQTFR